MNFVKLIWKKWLPIAHVIGNFQAQVILTIFYVVLFLPLGVLSRLIFDFLNIRTSARTSNFIKWEHPKESLEQARKPY